MLNSFLNFLGSVKLQVVARSSTAYMRTILRLRGITVGKSVTFVGVSKFVRSKNSTITVSEGCTFRSIATSNLIGINRPCIVSAVGENSTICIGSNCGFSGTVIGCFMSIVIGNNVRCGANTMITDSDWHHDDARSRPNRPVIIRDGVWLGVNVMVLKGVTIGENSVIGAGSVVTRDIPSNVIAAGNPCKVIMPLHK